MGSRGGRGGGRGRGGGGGGYTPPIGSERGLPGAFIMCDQGREKRALQEAADLILDAVRGLYPALFSGGGEGDGDDATAAQPLTVAEQLAAELAEITRPGPGAKRPRSSSSGVRAQFTEITRALGIVYLVGLPRIDCEGGSTTAAGEGGATAVAAADAPATSPPLVVDMVRVLNTIATATTVSKQHSVRNVARLIPVQVFTHARASSILATITTLLAGGPPAGATWCLEFRSRNTTLVSRSDVIDGVARLMPQGMRVDLENAALTVVVEVCGTLAGVALVRDHAWVAHCRYNLRTLAETPEERELRLGSALRASAEALAKQGGGEKPAAPKKKPASAPRPPVAHDGEQRRFVITLPGGDSAHLEYEIADSSASAALGCGAGTLMDLTHTYTPPSARGQGTAAVLVRAAFDWAGKKGMKILPSCTYISATFLPSFGGEVGFSVSSPSGVAVWHPSSKVAGVVWVEGGAP